ncbi:hypothetical protein HOD96_00025 [Candidatus Falkowbacteria bacterium]|jgi:hypothetical protein|nr:hypothetical protein [Candidatus Falkowbacteria bacterium]MBT4432796.1 hypothetical protein [Candidatus Falkowbacteria bacterium]
MTEKLDQININKKESDNNREKFILSRSTTIAELVQQGMLTKEQQDVLELGDEITLWEYIAYEPAEGKMTEDTEKIERLVKMSPEKLLEDLIKDTDICIEFNSKSDEELQKDLEKAGVKLPEWKDIENRLKISEAKKEGRITPEKKD